MDDQQLPQQPTKAFTPAEVAALVGVPVHSIRRWCEYHKEHLSEFASPDPGQARRLTRRDIEVLRAVKQLRDEGLTVPVINEQLRDIVFGEIDSADSNSNTALTAQEGPQQALGAIVAVEALQSILAPVLASQQAQQAQIDDLMRQRPTWRDVIIMVLFALVVGVMIGLSIWWFQ
jgi:DNA-binding transcriptional MerR regulator